ncbi:MAG: DNA photolyase family protein [Xanthomonadales bacterium]|nr:DNA photolyase family protein [Xanthomonadales bacterium]
MACALIWLRNDLRLMDNPALQSALRQNLIPVPVYIHAPDEEGDWRPGAASDAWRHYSLTALAKDLESRGSRLHVAHGSSLETLKDLAIRHQAKAVFWNRRYEPAMEIRDSNIKQMLIDIGVQARSHNGSLLFEPWEVETQSGDPYRVFTPFWRRALAQWKTPALTDAPQSLPKPPTLVGGVSIDALGLRPSPAWDKPFWSSWVPGEYGAQTQLKAFIDNAVETYTESRDIPATSGTSRLSPHLHFGEISPWRIADAVYKATLKDVRDVVVRQLGWRDFAHHVLHHFPQVPDHDFNPRFRKFPWLEPADKILQAWQSGRTGIPIVDAGMRELWHTGYMHNRVRMIAASLLTKNLRIHWRMGERWFWDTLVDADLANNAMGWQWVAGTGVDAAPYHRVFNPIRQAQRFDPQGEYIARWVPELQKLAPAQRHAPWTGVIPRGYPKPIVDLDATRKAALAALSHCRS